MPLPLIAIIVVFCVGYLCIILEHSVEVDKAAAALLTGVLCWVVYIVAAPGLVDAGSLALPQGLHRRARRAGSRGPCRPRGAVAGESLRCDATKPTAAQTLVKCGAKNLNPNLNGDSDAKGNALCDGLYKLDMDCDPVMEDADGNFVKAVFNAAHDMVTTGIPAKPFWDAGEVLSDKTKTGWRSASENHAKKRQILPSSTATATAASPRRMASPSSR